MPVLAAGVMGAPVVVGGPGGRVDGVVTSELTGGVVIGFCVVGGGVVGGGVEGGSVVVVVVVVVVSGSSVAVSVVVSGLSVVGNTGSRGNTLSKVHCCLW